MRKLYIVIILLAILSVAGCGEDTIMTSIKDGKQLEDGENSYFGLYQNYPNPFNPMTTIRFFVAVQMHLKLSVFTEDWEPVKILLDKNILPGYYESTFEAKTDNGESLPSGNYYYTLEGNGYVMVRTMKLMK